MSQNKNTSKIQTFELKALNKYFYSVFRDLNGKFEEKELEELEGKINSIEDE